MKKSIIGIFILVLAVLIIMGTNVYAATPTLEQIVNKFNNCSTVKQYATSGSIWKASHSNNKLTIVVTANNNTTNVEYSLANTILSANFSKSDALTGVMVTTVLADSIGQLHGYKDGELFPTLNSEEISTYSVENQGFEIKKSSDESYQIKIDISKKIPLIDASDVYIEVSDLEGLKSFISGDGSAEQSKGNIWFNKRGYDGENTLLIAEKNELTENAYKSVLSIIEVMFDSNKASEYFKSNYSGLSVGDKEFTGFKIEINPTKTEFEDKLIPDDSGYKFARITIKKSLVNSQINGSDNVENEDEDEKIEDNTNQENSTPQEEDNTQSSNELPKTGKSATIIFAILSIILIAIISRKKYCNYKDIK